MTYFRRLFAASTLSLLAVGALYAQAPQQAEPGTSSPRVAPASAAPQTHPDPNLRTDSMPHTSLSPSTDSSPTPENLGLDANDFVALGLDTKPTTPAGMIGTIPPGNPTMLFMALPRRTADQIAPADAALLTSRQGDLDAAARHYDLQQPGWAYQQVVCAATEPGALTSTGVAGGQGSLLLQYTRGAGPEHALLTAVVPHDGGDVRTIAVLRGKPPRKFFSRKKHDDQFQLNKHDHATVNEALPPTTLFAHLQPREDWLATSACIAALGGADPQIPEQPDLDEVLTTFPGPLLRLLIDGERKMVFSDRIDDSHYSVWNEEVTSKGKLHLAKQKTYAYAPLPVTNPPEAPIITIPVLPQPPSKQLFPPSPLSGEKQ